MAEHYGCLIDPAWALKPKDKPRVERQMPYVRDSMWRGRTWTGVAEIQTGATTWCLDVASRRELRSLEGAAPITVFESIEAAALIAYRRNGELASWSTPKVGSDCHVKVGRTLYSVPWPACEPLLQKRKVGRRQVRGWFGCGDRHRDGRATGPLGGP